MTTIPQISTMVTFRQRRCELVDAFVTGYRSDVTEALDLLLSSESGGEVPTTGAWPLLIDPLMRRLKEALAEMIEAERQHLNEVGGDALTRHRRDQAIVELKQFLFDLRDIYRGLYGKLQVQQMGFEKRIAKHPLPLLRQSQRIANHHLEVARQPAAPRYLGLGIDQQRALEHLEGRIRELREAMDQVNDDLARVQKTKVGKDRAIKAFDGTYRLIVRMLISAFRLSDQPELAAKLPISLRRPTKKDPSVSQ